MMGETDSKRGCVFYGCVGVLLVGLLLAGLAALSLWRAWKVMPEIDPCCEAYLTAVENGDYKAACDLTNERWRAAQSFPKFVEFETKMRKALGACTSKSCTTWRANFTPGGAGSPFLLSRRGRRMPGRFESGSAVKGTLKI